MIKNILLLFSLVILCQAVNTNKPILKQVIVLSRHNVRTPIRPGLLHKYSPKNWPVLEQRPGQLTKKGALMEGYMGGYFKQWFESEHFLKGNCPDAESVYVYANSMNRTVETAKAFVKSAFGECNVTVHHKYAHEEMEPMFSPIISNTTAAFKSMVINEIKLKLNHTNLSAAYLELNNILDIKNSKVCKLENICDLSDVSKNKISFKVGRQLWVNGPLHIANTVVDSFAMSYYEGLQMKNVAWGLLRTPEEWKTITEIGRRDQVIRYSTVAEDYGASLKKCLSRIFMNYTNMPKFILIVGHDFNQNAFITTMGFKSFNLPNHYELYPIGGKIVFQRWEVNKKDYLKIEYVYPSWSQIRNGTKFSMEDPPQRVLLELQWCDVDETGLCPWSEFVHKLGLML